MDYTILVIGLSLVLVGAVFFGYPIGKTVGRRRMRREFEEKYIFEVAHENEHFGSRLPDCVANSLRRLEKDDVLSAEIIYKRGQGNDD